MVVPSMARTFAKSDVDQVFDNYLGQRTPQFMSETSGSSTSSTENSDSATERSYKKPRSDLEKKERRRAQNRSAAATSRNKKKKYHQNLEVQMESLASQNTDLQQQLQRVLAENERLRATSTTAGNAPPPPSQNLSFLPSYPVTSTSIPTTTTEAAPELSTTSTTATTTTSTGLAQPCSPPMPMGCGISSTHITIESAELPFPQQPEVMAMVLVSLSLSFVVWFPIMLLKLNMSRLKAFSRRTSQWSCTATLASKALESTTFCSSATPKTKISMISDLRSWPSIHRPAASMPG